jgi:uncharacterized membrane protein
MSDRHRPLGGDRVGILAERFARFFGTTRLIIARPYSSSSGSRSTRVVSLRWDPDPFILLNLLFSTQAA